MPSPVGFCVMLFFVFLLRGYAKLLQLHSVHAPGALFKAACTLVLSPVGFCVMLVLSEDWSRLRVPMVSSQCLISLLDSLVCCSVFVGASSKMMPSMVLDPWVCCLVFVGASSKMLPSMLLDSFDVVVGFVLEQLPSCCQVCCLSLW